MGSEMCIRDRSGITQSPTMSLASPSKHIFVRYVFHCGLCLKERRCIFFCPSQGSIRTFMLAKTIGTSKNKCFDPLSHPHGNPTPESLYFHFCTTTPPLLKSVISPKISFLSSNSFEGKVVISAHGLWLLSVLALLTKS